MRVGERREPWDRSSGLLTDIGFNSSRVGPTEELGGQIRETLH